MAYQLRNASILIIDDMKPMLMLTASLLKIFGFTNIHMATDAEDGFRSYCKHNPDIVITDWLMEPFDGIELTRKIRTEKISPNKFVPVVLMTGYSHKMRVMQARDAGVTEFLVKPFRAVDLYKRIEQLVEKPRKFVDTGEFFGPDRRRKKPDGYHGPFRREGEEIADPPSLGKSPASDLLKSLQEEAKKTSKE